MLTPDKITEKAIEVGKSKASLSCKKLLLLGFLAGVFIALAGVGSSIGASLGGKLVGALIFPVGLIMVILAGSELFTGNNLMIIAWLKGEISFGKLLKNWGVVYLGNFLGALFVSFFVVYSGILDPISESVVQTATAKSTLSFHEALIRGIFCNFLVCIAVWLSFSAKTVPGKILAIFGPVFLFVLCSFEHSIANMFYGPTGMLIGYKNGILMENLNVVSFLVNNLIPVTIGNIFGGAILVGFIYYLIYQKK